MNTNINNKDDFIKKQSINNMTDEQHIENLSEFFKLFGDKTRLRIIEVLTYGELSVGTIAQVLDMSQSSISHQLRLLKRSRLVKSRKEGKWVYYSISDEHVETVFSMGLDHILEK